MGKTVSVPEIEAALRQFDDDLDKARQGKITFFDVRLPGGKKLGRVSQDDMKHLGELLRWRGAVYGRTAEVFRALCGDGKEVK